MKFLKYILSIILWINFWITAFIVIFFLIMISLFVPKKFYNPLVRLACILISRSVFIFPVLRDKNKVIPFPVIYVANHVSFFDLFICGTILPGYPRGIELKEHFDKPIYGWFIKRFGQIPIDLKSKGSIKHSFEEAEKILHNKIRNILIMPEGTRTRDGNIGNFRYGAFFLSRKANIPIVPVLFLNLYKRNNPTSLLINPGKVDVDIMDPVYPENFNSDEEMGRYVKEIMIKRFKEYNNEAR